MKRKSLFAILMLTLGVALVISIPTGPTAASQELLGTLLPEDTVDDPSKPINLGVGGRRFWPDEPVNVDQAAVIDPANCTLDLCPEYRLRVAPGGTRLRVALSVVYQEPEDVRPWPDLNGGDPHGKFSLRLLRSDRTEVVKGSTHDHFGHEGYAVELRVEAPESGEWIVQVVPTDVVDLAFRLRAKLEGPADERECGIVDEDVDNSTPDPGAAPCMPNLRIIPPYEFNFNTPVVTNGPDSGITGAQPGCMPEEIREAEEEVLREAIRDRDGSIADPLGVVNNGVGAVPSRCLRFSMGIENIGVGPLLLVATQSDINAEEPDELVMTQARRYSDGDWEWDGFGQAGTGQFDHSHQHLHYIGLYHFDLFRVTDSGWRPGDAEPALESVGPARKLGGAPTNEYMADWGRFFQSAQNEAITFDFRPHPACQLPSFSCVPAGLNQNMIQLAGWGDIYEWNRTGNYVSFPNNADGSPREGFYFVRGTTNLEGKIIETSQADNISYALIYVHSHGGVDLKERGYGRGPWDPRRQIIRESP